MSELKPCRFCSSVDVGTGRRVPGIEFAVHCFSCGAVGPTDLTIEDAEGAWNRRAMPPCVRELLLWYGSADDYINSRQADKLFRAIREYYEEGFGK